MYQKILWAVDGGDASQRAIKEASRLAQALGAELKVINIAIESAAEIVRQATICRADLILMGTHGKSALRRRALGSEAERVIHIAPVPVLLARNRRDEADERLEA